MARRDAGAGSYLNEGDINEPAFQQAFYGDKYERLYKIKQTYDPTGRFMRQRRWGPRTGRWRGRSLSILD